MTLRNRIAIGVIAYAGLLALMNILPREWGYTAGVWTRRALDLVMGGGNG